MNSPCAAGRPENPSQFLRNRRSAPTKSSRSLLPSDNNERRAPCCESGDARRLVKPPPAPGPAAGAPLASIRGGLGVAATRVGDAAVSILGEGCEASRQKAEPKEGGERQCE